MAPTVKSTATDRAAFQTAPLFTPNKRLEFEAVLHALEVDRLVAPKDAEELRATRRVARADLHPLVIIANAKLADPRKNNSVLTLDVLTEWLALKAELPYLRIDPTKISVAEVGQVVTPNYAMRHRILPISINVREIVVATSEPFDLRWVADLAHLTRREIKRVVANPLEVNRYLVEFFGVTQSVRRAKDNKKSEGPGLSNFEQLVELGQSGDLSADDQHVVRIVDWLFTYAYEQRASDIHLEPRRDTSRVRFRIDGVLHTVFEMPTTVMLAVTSRIKVIGRLDIAERRRPQDGRIKMRMQTGREVELRLSTMPTAFGEKIVLRIFDPEIAFKKFPELGFSKHEDQSWREMVERPHGIVLVTGPTGSGKTTTLYTTLKYLATNDVNVCTVEDPIEMIAGEFNQMQVHTAIDLTFAAGIRTLMRQDPDIIMVGEIRDLETAEMAVQASLTGHLVLSTLHTNDAPAAVPRLMDLGVPYYLLQNTLAGIVAQRLVRTLCPRCKTTGSIDAKQWAFLTHGFSRAHPAVVARPVGCPDCRNTGYYGRTGVYEMMPITDELRAGIRMPFDLTEFRKFALQHGMTPLRLSGADQILRGLTTFEEVKAVMPPE